MPPQPPYALAAIEVRFRALSTLAGRSPLGGGREHVLVALMAARLAADVELLSPGAREARAAGARAWLTAVTLPATLRVPFRRLLDACVGDDREALRAAFIDVSDVAHPHLDGRSRLEMRDVARALES
ncbi:MAG TPA: hypothetical protein VFG84_00880 [Gemmatimonadaceae bacterium]|nr:hypothetical protein [Gemmatimonadaceae bacterium]